MAEVFVYRKAHFNAAHRLFNPKWSNEENQKVFGKCANPFFHGHNYELIVGVKGEVDPETGFVINLDFLKKIIEMEVLDYLDHKNLNEQVPEFKKLNPTVENIVVVVWNLLRNRIPKNLFLEITLYETERNFAVYNGN